MNINRLAQKSRRHIQTSPNTKLILLRFRQFQYRRVKNREYSPENLEEIILVRQRGPAPAK